MGFDFPTETNQLEQEHQRSILFKGNAFHQKKDANVHAVDKMIEDLSEFKIKYQQMVDEHSELTTELERTLKENKVLKKEKLLLDQKMERLRTIVQNIEGTKII